MGLNDPNQAAHSSLTWDPSSPISAQPCALSPVLSSAEGFLPPGWAMDLSWMEFLSLSFCSLSLGWPLHLTAAWFPHQLLPELPFSTGGICT